MWRSPRLLSPQSVWMLHWASFSSEWTMVSVCRLLVDVMLKYPQILSCF